MIPCISRWPDLADEHIEVLQEGASQEGRWAQSDPPMVLRLHGAMTIALAPCDDGISIQDAVLRPTKDGTMAWVGKEMLGIVAPAPQDHETLQETRGILQWAYTYTVILPPRARDLAERLAVFRRAFSLALGPDAQARVAAFRALGTARLLTQGATSGIVKPLENTPRILVHRPEGGTSTQGLFPKASARATVSPDARALLHGGRCRQVLSVHNMSSARTIAPCDEIHLSLPSDFSRHAMMAAIDEAIERFATLGVDIRPWLFRRGH